MIRISVVVAVALLATGAWYPAWSGEQDDATLIKAMSVARVTLQQGLTASLSKGRPISAKFEMEDGKLQLSIYTRKSGQSFEVIVDHMKGGIAKTEAITEGDDLVAAKSQGAAMAKAKVELKAAADKAAAGNPVVSVTPSMRAGQPVASIVVVKDGKLQTLSQPLN